MNDFDKNNSGLLEELRSLETELHKDETRRNRKRMETLLDPEFVEFGRSGARYTRDDILREFGQRKPPCASSHRFPETFYMWLSWVKGSPY